MDTSQPAFPCTEANGLNNGVQGMTLRDYFAAQAMANAYTHTIKKSTSQIAEWAYEIADAMISVREL